MFKILDGRSQFYQWDIDRKVIVEDASINEVHFCNRTDDCSLICEVYELDGLRVADVPNILLQENWRINVYAYDTNYTKHCEVFEVVRRSKPADYVYTETEIKNYDELLERLEQIEQNGISDETVAAAVEKYMDENDINVDLTGYATEQYVNEKIEDIELTPGPAGKDGKDGYTPVKGVDYFDGAPGADGKDGDDYVLTDADKQEIAGMVEVTGGGDAVEEVHVGTSAPTNPSIKLWVKPGDSSFATKQYVDEQIDGIEIPEIDMSDYYTKNQTNKAIETYIAGITHPQPDLSNYYKKNETYSRAEMNEKYAQKIDIEVAGYASEQFVLDEIASALAAIGVAEEGAY